MASSALTLALSVALAACGSPLSDAKGVFKKGHDGEARETLMRAEPESREWDLGRRAEYALCRGLTHGALGDRQGAGVWPQGSKQRRSRTRTPVALRRRSRAPSPRSRVGVAGRRARKSPSHEPPRHAPRELIARWNDPRRASFARARGDHASLDRARDKPGEAS